MVEDKDKTRKPVRKPADTKTTGSRNSAQSAGSRERSDSVSHSHNDSRSRQQGSSGQYGSRPRPQGQGHGDSRSRQQGSTGQYGSRPKQQGQGRPEQKSHQGGDRQGQRAGPRSGDDRSRGTPSPQTQGSRPYTDGHRSQAGAGRPQSAPRYPKDTAQAKNEDIGLGLSEDDAPSEPKVRLPKKSDTTYTSSYRGSSQKSGPKSSPNKQSKKTGGKTNREAFKKQPMLNTHKINPFKYDMNEILSQSSMDPNMASGFLASVIAKASRISTKEAKDYAKTFLDEGNLTKDEYDKICRLMDRYSKFR